MNKKEVTKIFMTIKIFFQILFKTVTFKIRKQYYKKYVFCQDLKTLNVDSVRK